MAMMGRLLENNAAWSARFTDADAPARPALKVAIVTCMDARLDPAQALGLGLGEAHVIRNAGGVVTEDVIRSLSISQHMLGTEEIMIMHHTDCGLLTFSDEEFARAREQSTGELPAWKALAFDDLDEDVRQGVKLVKANPFIPRRDRVRGFVYEVESGRVREVT